MPRLKAISELMQIQFRIERKQYRRLQEMYANNIGVQAALRAIVNAFLAQTDAQQRDAIDAVDREFLS